MCGMIRLELLALTTRRNLVSTDFSEVVIEKMRAKHQAARPELRWEKMDMLALDAADASFDAVVDKVRVKTKGSVKTKGRRPCGSRQQTPFALKKTKILGVYIPLFYMRYWE